MGGVAALVSERGLVRACVCIFGFCRLNRRCGELAAWRKGVEKVCDVREGGGWGGLVEVMKRKKSLALHNWHTGAAYTAPTVTDI